MRIPFVALALFAVPTLCTAQDVTAIGKSEYYPVKVGTVWKYSTGAGTVTTKVTKHEEVEGKTCAVFESDMAGNKSAEHVFIDKEGIYRMKMANQPIKPAWKFLQLPAKAGSEWKGKSTVAGATLEGTSTIKMGEVKVPKGSYKDVLMCTGKINVQGQEIETTIYLAKGIGMVKQEVRWAARTSS